MLPRYLSRHTFDEVAGWFHEAGLTDVVDLSRDQVFFHAGQETASTSPAAGRSTRSAPSANEPVIPGAHPSR